MLGLAFVFLAAAAASQTFPFEIGSNKSFVQVKLNDSAPQWFILDTGNNADTIIARECADRLKIKRGAEEPAEIGAGTPGLSLDQARAMLREPVARKLDIRRGDQTLEVKLPSRRMV